MTSRPRALERLRERKSVQETNLLSHSEGSYAQRLGELTRQKTVVLETRKQAKVYPLSKQKTLNNGQMKDRKVRRKWEKHTTCQELTSLSHPRQRKKLRKSAKQKKIVMQSGVDKDKKAAFGVML